MAYKKVMPRTMMMARRKAIPLSLGGLSSRPYGPKVSRAALGSVPVLVAGRRMVPDWYRAMSGCSMGDDATTGTMPVATVDATADATDSSATWQQQMLTTSQQILASQQDFTQREILTKWIQIAATLSIPLAAAVWRAIFKKSRGSERDYE